MSLNAVTALPGISGNNVEWPKISIHLGIGDDVPHAFSWGDDDPAASHLISLHVFSCRFMTFPTATPRFATPRSERDTKGPEATKIAQNLGIELMPWQQGLLDVALEVEPDGRYRFREVRFGTPRQSGKTTALLVRAVLEAESVKRSTSVYCAQTGMDARNWVSREVGPLLVEYDDTIKLWLANGSERAVWPNGSRLLALANSLSSGHGKTIDLAIMDEIFSWVDDRLIVAVKPSMITKQNAQSYLCSTAGTLDSIIWRSLVDDGRARCLSGNHGRVCYVEYSADDLADIADPATWWGVMPALGHTITQDIIQAEFDSSPDPAFFMRSFLNMWTATESTLIPPKAWAGCFDPIAAPEGSLHCALDIAPGQEGGRSCSIVVVGSNLVMEVVDTRPGVGWVIDRLQELDLRNNFMTVSADSVGPIRSILPEIADTIGQKRLKILGTADVCAAAQRLHQAILESSVKHRGQESLDAAAAGAVKRSVGDAWTWGRKNSLTDVSSLVAAGLAHYQALQYGESDARIY